MQFFQKSVQELITQTSTNLPPDVRQAMAAAINDAVNGSSPRDRGTGEVIA